MRTRMLVPQRGAAGVATVNAAGVSLRLRLEGRGPGAREDGAGAPGDPRGLDAELAGLPCREGEGELSQGRPLHPKGGWGVSK